MCLIAVHHPTGVDTGEHRGFDWLERAKEAVQVEGGEWILLP